MATVKKGILTRAGEWAKHLRPWGKREFWGGERKAAKREIEYDVSCGCVFCDVGLKPTNGYHEVSGEELITCRRTE